MPPSAAQASNIPTIESQFLRRFGIPTKMRNASTAPPPAPVHPAPLPLSLGHMSALVTAASVLTVNCVLDPTAAAPAGKVHEGVSAAALVGPEVCVQAKVTVPV